MKVLVCLGLLLVVTNGLTGRLENVIFWSLYGVFGLLLHLVFRSWLRF